MNDTKLWDRFGLVVGSTLGEGTFAKVKLAFSSALNSNVALKIIHKKRASKGFLERFLPREIKIVQQLRHPNIVHHFQYINTTHRAIIVMEYAECGTLLELL